MFLGQVLGFSRIDMLGVSNHTELKLDHKVVSTQANDFMSIFKNNKLQGQKMNVHGSLLRESGFQMAEMPHPGKHHGS